MARITRTVIGTRATVLTVNRQLMTAENKDFIIGGTFDNNDKLLKALKKSYDNAEQILSAVIKTKKCEKLYGLDECVFMKYAVELDPKTRKPLTEPQAVAADSEPQAVAADNEPQAVTADNEPQAVTTDSEPQAVTADSEPHGVGITAPVTITHVSAKASKIKK